MSNIKLSAAAVEALHRVKSGDDFGETFTLALNAVIIPIAAVAYVAAAVSVIVVAFIALSAIVTIKRI